MDNGCLYVCRTVRRTVQTRTAFAQAGSRDCGVAWRLRVVGGCSSKLCMYKWVSTAGIRWTSESVAGGGRGSAHCCGQCVKMDLVGLCYSQLQTQTPN
jgi:hypothetical protein